MLIWASLALPFHSRQRRRSISSTIAAFASTRAGSSADNPPAVCFRCCSRHRDVKPIEDWRIGDAGGGQYGSETGASIGETGQLRVAGPANGIELPADQRDDVGIGSDDGSENLASSNLRLDIETLHLQMPFAVLTATDEGRVQADGDRRSAVTSVTTARP